MSRSYWPAQQATPWWEDPPSRWYLAVCIGLYLAPMLLAAHMVQQGYDAPAVVGAVAALTTASSYAAIRIIRNHRGK